ncbi:hypothetical protein FKM82_015718 [Ascaphus truei]
MLGSGTLGGSGERGRLRLLLRGSVAGLCELKLLRERQEVRVRRAVQGGGEDLDRQLWELERQLGELRLKAENDSQSVGYEQASPEPCDVFVELPSRVGQTEARMHYANERPKSAGDLVLGSRPPRAASRFLVPRSLSAPYPSPPTPTPPSRRAEGYIMSLLRRQLRPPYLRSTSADRPPPPPPPACRMVSASYIPPNRGPRRKHPPLLKGHSVEGSPPRAPRKCLSAEEPPRKRGGRRTPRSLSETSLRDPSHPKAHGEEWGDPRGHTQEGGRCYTLGREGREPEVRTGPPCRRWRSTAEISGEGQEVESGADSEGEGGLVWPLQLPPRDVDGHPQLFKVKASQALKKKIMRFHTGSLKVMTTV